MDTGEVKKPKNWLESLNYAIEGVIYAFKTQRHVRYHYVIAAAALCLSLFLELPVIEFVLFAMAVIILLFAEMMNTAIEETVNLVEDQYHIMAKKAKDVSAGAVLIASIGVAIMAYMIFSKYIYEPMGFALREAKAFSGHIAVVALLFVLIAVVTLKAFSGKGRPLHGGLPSGHPIIVADEKARPALCAADLLAQAEHDALASEVFITTSADLAERVDKEIEMQLGKLKRRSPVRKAIDAGTLVIVDNMAQGVELVNLCAPEHLSIVASNASALAKKVRNAGCIFVGENSPVVLGEYVAGPSHVLPTGGSARFGSPLGVADFLKVTNVIVLDKPAMRKLSGAATVIAKAEGLDAHARAVAHRVIASQPKQSRRLPSRLSIKGHGEGEK